MTKKSYRKYVNSTAISTLLLLAVPALCASAAGKRGLATDADHAIHCGNVTSLETLDSRTGLAEFFYVDSNGKESIRYSTSANGSGTGDGSSGSQLVLEAYQTGGVLCVCGSLKLEVGIKAFDATTSPLRLAKTYDEAHAFKQGACASK